MNYLTISEELSEFHFAEDVCFSHGLLCGYAIIKPELEFSQWLNEILEEYNSEQQSLTPLQKLFNETLSSLSDAELDFSLLLNTDSAKLELETLIQWSSGFLYGLGLGQVSSSEEEVEEVINGIIEISQIDSNISGTSEEENDIFELVEFVRMGVLLIQEIVNPDKIDFVSPK